MKGCTIYVMRRIGDGKAQVTGIDTKYVNEQVSVELGHDMYLLVSPYKEINRGPLWKRLRRWLLIREANFRLWITSRAEHGSSDIRMRTPAPVTDAAFHAPLTLSLEQPPSKPESIVSTSNEPHGFLAESTPVSESYSTPDMWWKCEKCDQSAFLGMCAACKHVTQF